MTAYWAILSARFRMLLQYRAAAFAGFSTQLFWGLMRVMIFTAFYQSSTAQQPMTLQQTITYIWLSQAMLAMLPWNIDGDIRAMVRSGTVAYELVRPVDLYWLWFSRLVAQRSAPTLLRAVPMLLLAALFLGMEIPGSWAAFGAWTLSMLAALFLAAAISAVLSISILWTISGEGIARFVTIAVMVFAGTLVPLPLFPNWAQGFLNALPFRGLVDIPFRLYMGHIPPNHLIGVLAHQLGWTVVLILLGRFMLSLGTRKLVVQGG